MFSHQIESSIFVFCSSSRIFHFLHFNIWTRAEK